MQNQNDSQNVNIGQQSPLNQQQGGVSYPQHGQIPNQRPTPNVSREVPMCTVCGYIGSWKKERLFHIVPLVIAGGCIFYLTMMRSVMGMHYNDGIAILAGMYFAFFVPYAIVRMTKKKVRICAKCDSVEKFTFLY